MSKEYVLKIVSSNLFQFEIQYCNQSFTVLPNFLLCVCFQGAQGLYSGLLLLHPRYGDIPDGDLQQSAMEVLFL
jgi:hypothetical protein